MLRLDSSQCCCFVILFGKATTLAQRLKSTDCVLVAVISRQLVPPLGFNHVLVNVDADFVVVSHGKLASR